jgi:ribonuclease E
MDDDATVATPTATGSAPASEQIDERLAAFKRGAPVPKPKAEPRTIEPKLAPKPKAEPKAKPEAKTQPEPTAEPEPRSKPQPRSRSSQRPKSAPAARTETAEPTEGTSAPATDAGSPEGVGPSEGSSTSAPRKRRRRGGRGRGGRSGGSGQGDIATASPDATLDSQRDDALPDLGNTSATTGDATDGPASDRAGSSSGARRRRGSRGRGSTKRSSDSKEAAGGNGAESTEEAKAKAPPKAGDRGSSQRQRSQPKNQTKTERAEMSAEERVAAGGPTRGIRSSRSRTGRSGRDGRRRREPDIVPPRFTDKLMVITEHGDRDQIAVLEEDVLVQHYVTRTGATSMVGNVYLGRVQNVLPGMEAAFVDIGRGRNGVLYAGEVNYSPEDLEGSVPRIEQVLKPGQAVMVQVTKDPMGGKGARLTAQISLPGRFLVFAPNQNLSGISRRLGEDERRKLKTILRKVKPSEHGVIVRTAAEGASEEAITHDLKRLIAQWDEIQKAAKKVKAPNVLSEEPELTVRVVRDLFTDEEYKGLVTDSPRVHEKVMAYVNDVAPDLAPKVSLLRGALPAFEEHRIEEQIHKALDRKVWLPSGGYLVIERTEAMTIVDVNTGKSVGKTNLEETVVNTNLEAAKEVARQLRLRDIGGIIVVDFIDMLLEKNKKQVEDTMKEALALDKTRSQVFEIGPLGLMQVTRKRVSGGLVESFSETCPTCEGRGILLNYGS